MVCIPCQRHRTSSPSLQEADVDCHILTLPRDRQDWLEEAVESVRGQANLYVVDGVEGHLGQSRALGYAQGEAPFVCHVDSDDILLDGAVRACLDVFQRDPSLVCVWTNRFEMDADGGNERKAWLSLPEKPFRIYAPTQWHFFVARRAFLMRTLHDHTEFETYIDAVIQHRLGGMGEFGYIPQPYYKLRYHGAGMGLRGITEKEDAFLRNGWSWAG